MWKIRCHEKLLCSIICYFIFNYMFLHFLTHCWREVSKTTVCWHPSAVRGVHDKHYRHFLSSACSYDCSMSASVQAQTARPENSVGSAVTWLLLIVLFLNADGQMANEDLDRRIWCANVIVNARMHVRTDTCTHTQPQPHVHELITCCTYVFTSLLCCWDEQILSDVKNIFLLFCYNLNTIWHVTN